MSSATAAPIRLDGVEKIYDGGGTAVADLSLDIAAGELVALVGPSGCGKSTVLRMINRLIEPTSGSIYVDGEDVTSSDPVELRRRIGYCIQHIGLFPHQTVAANVATVPRLLGWDRDKATERVEELLDLVGLDVGIHGKRYPHQLSGGQRQRVGVARALAADPVVLLMDEPFSAVDPIARGRLQEEFLRLQADVGKTIVFVTHDVDEAIRLGDKIAVLSNEAKLEQYGTPAEILRRPKTSFVSEFVGADRGVKSLSVTGLAQAQLRELPPGEHPTVTSAANLREALSRLLDGETGFVSVTESGHSLGGLSADDIYRALHSDDG
ncbi:ABC transporter ATP-binding protein [Stackebrandtia nassauensis]|uniref:ABC-type quaternary amine transporter n=1 Tax=Stackebrandtia nassauensis (strain DSM 44728 / CIP 108903 / NRRL B-16338 / NBRC 102104 / LLR-40K-21) TaxID=446470 RepID=D3QA31_STANL|nr:ABC transporter ATP-binding protein [Stackebrandtia nassauensis]ADD40743.1 ABC transporter related protein [Stackebrandtia nassauensis DSM 44728]